MSEGVSFTGERLHPGSALFGVDLARHRAAYRFACERAAGQRTLDLGCGSGYGAAELAPAARSLVAVDRVPPDAEARASAARFVRATFEALPFRAASFDLVVSFQVIEHLDDPSDYLRATSALLSPGGTVIFSTPNLATSDGENPFHVHEYEAAELARTLGAHFEDVEMLGVGLSARVAPYFEARLARIRRIVRLDPLGLRRRLPRGLVEWLFAFFAKVVRRGIQSDQGLPDAELDDFPIGPADEHCIDLLAVCRRPRG